MTMDCALARALLPQQPVGSLDEDEAGDLERHLEGCAACQREADALSAACALLAAPVLEDEEPALPPGAWKAIEGRLATGARCGSDSEPAPDERSQAPRIAIACTFCHGRLLRAEACYCAGCLAPHHGDCFRAHGRCSAPGCEETHTVRPVLELPPTPRRVAGRGVLLLLAAAGVGAVAALSPGGPPRPRTSAATAAPEPAPVEVPSPSHAQADRPAPPAPLPAPQVLAPRPPAYLGLHLRPTRDARGLDVWRVFPGGPADRAGLEPHDLITAVRAPALPALPLPTLELLDQAVRQVLRPGEPVTLDVVRRGERLQVQLVPVDASPPPAARVTTASGRPLVPVRVLGSTPEGRALVATAPDATLEGGTYLLLYEPEGKMLGQLTVVQRVGGTQDSFWTFSATFAPAHEVQLAVGAICYVDVDEPRAAAPAAKRPATDEERALLATALERVRARRPEDYGEALGLLSRIDAASELADQARACRARIEADLALRTAQHHYALGDAARALAAMDHAVQVAPPGSDLAEGVRAERQRWEAALEAYDLGREAFYQGDANAACERLNEVLRVEQDPANAFRLHAARLLGMLDERVTLALQDVSAREVLEGIASQCGLDLVLPEGDGAAGGLTVSWWERPLPECLAALREEHGVPAVVDGQGRLRLANAVDGDDDR